MPLDLRVHRKGHAGARFELLQHRDFLIELLSVSIHCLNHVGHVTNSIGVEGNSHNHPGDGEEALTVRYNGYVSEAHCGDRLQSPVKGNSVLETDRLIYHALLDHPAVVCEVLPLSL